MNISTGFKNTTTTSNITIPTIALPLSWATSMLSHDNTNISPQSPVTMASSTAPLSPTSSFYTLSDDEEGEYNTITHISTGRGVKLLYSKSKVYVHPSPSAKDNIPGYIALLQQKPAPDGRHSTTSSATSRAASSLLLAWLPEDSLGDAKDIYVKVDLDEGDSPPKKSYLVPPPPTMTRNSASLGHYAFAIPISAVYSLLVRPPSLGWWYGSVVINSRMGDSFPALFFHDNECPSTIMQKKKLTRESFDPFGASGEMFWGGDEVLRWVKRYVEVTRSGAEPNIYLVEPSVEDREAFGTKPVTAAIVRDPAASRQVIGATGTGDGSSNAMITREATMDPVTKFMKETSWNIMEKLSKVTTFTRRTADSIVDNPKVPPQVRRLLGNPQVQTLQDEFDSARIYLAKWSMGIAEQSERDRNQKIWTAQDVLEMEETDVGQFELLDTEMGSLAMKEQRKSVTLKEWNAYFDQRTGRLQVTIDEVKDRIFHGGLDMDDGVRKEAWLFLLGVYDWHSSYDERKAEMASLRDEYIKLKGAWWERLVDLGGEGEEGEWWREQKSRIDTANDSHFLGCPVEKDVHRTDRNIPLFAGEDTPHPDPGSPFAEVGTNVHLEQLKDMLLTYNEYNRDLGYVQGMSDLLAPIYAVMQDDAAAFWCFQHFMDRMEPNFLRDQSGMRKQLLNLDQLVQLMDPKLYLHLQKADSTNFFFFFRMLLVWFKREFAWVDILHLWETLWTDHLSSNFHLFIALAILEKHRSPIIDHLEHFDEVLKYVNELSNTIDLEQILVRAEALFHRFQRTVEAVDKKSNFPTPKLRQRLTSKASTSSDSVQSATSHADIDPEFLPTIPSSAHIGTVSAAQRAQASATGINTAANPSRPSHSMNQSSVVKGKCKTSSEIHRASAELEETPKPKIISSELRELLSRKVETLPRRMVRKEGEGLANVRK
ncbi:GTPase-activating protein GYP7 [Calycina marina]|uniref:GTPase-activating protein GYP7 n=1 Tax=Calycina marina TaxID=1763456 RepID=A0A9P8CC04_9HELO|nr:GTPase-activating protein GYP7 [Calycina marina]